MNVAGLRRLGSRLVEQSWPTLLVAAVCCGIAAGVWVRAPATLLIVVSGVAAIAASLAVVEIRRLALAAGALALLGLAWGGLRMDALDRSVLVSRIGDAASARVVVTGPVRQSQFSVRGPGLVTRFAGIRLRERVLLELPVGRAPPQGSVLDVRARPADPRGPETGFDERRWLARQGVHVVLRVSEARIVGRRGGIGGVADRLRAHIVDTLASGTTGEHRALVTGIVLGEESELSRSLRDAFRASGLTHLLAVSGQNVAITALGVVVGLRILGVGRLVGEGVAIVAVLAYALAAGWQPSVVRATVAGCLASLAWLAARPRDRWHAMAIGALVLLGWAPTSVLDPGFQLSFAAVAAIFVVVPRIERWLEGTPLAGKPAELTALAAACGAVTAPIVFLQFGSIPLWTIPANVLAEPAMGPLVSLSLLAAVAQPLSPSVAASLAWIAGWCAAWIAWVARLVAAWPAAQVRSWTAIAAMVGVVAVVVLVVRQPRARRAGAALTALALALSIGVGWWALHPRPTWTPPSGLRLTVLDVGQGDGILLETAAGGVLVDQGTPEADIAGQLRRRGIRSLSAIVLTHPQRDHVGGAAEVLRRLDVGSMIDPELDASASPDERAARAMARRREVPIVPARAGRAFRVGKLRLDILWPEDAGSPGEDPNLNATVILARYGNVTALLTADAESDILLRLPLPRIDVLKVSHHGSADPGLPELLRRIRPRVAVISVAARNDYGHPTPETLADLAAAPRLSVFRTDRDGAVTVESDGASVEVQTER